MRRGRAIEPVAGVVLGCATSVLVAAALYPFREQVANTSVALLLVLVVVGAAVIGGRAGGVAAALTSVLAFDFFHTAPYLRLTISSADDVETALLLGLVGVVVGTVAAGRASAERGQEQGRSEVRRLHRSAELVASGATPDAILAATRDDLVELLHLVDCRYEPAPFVEELPVLGHSGALPPATVHRRGTDGFALPPDGVALEVRSAGIVLGRFVLRPEVGAGAPLEQRMVAVALADQLGSVLARESPTTA